MTAEPWKPTMGWFYESADLGDKTAVWWAARSRFSAAPIAMLPVSEGRERHLYLMTLVENSRKKMVEAFYPRLSALAPSAEAESGKLPGGPCWCDVAPVPNGPTGHSVSASPEPISKVADAAGPAIGDNGDANSGGDGGDRLKVVAAHEAIAAYAREKKLPSAEVRATFGELDTAKANDRLRAAASGNLTVADIVRAMAILDANEVDGDRHSLASEPLGRAIDQLWGAQRGRTYCDLVGTGQHRVTDMLDG